MTADAAPRPPWLAATLAEARALLPRLPHALLIRGPGGWGEEQVADALALDVLERSDSPTPARRLAHPDLRWVAAEQGVVKIDAVRAVIGFLHQTPRLSPGKVAVIEDAERMNLNAANALLKSLEEPPDNSFLVLVSGASGRLLPTIRSRCQQLAMQCADNNEVLAWLVGQGLEEKLARQLSAECGAAPYAVLSAAERGDGPLWPSLASVGRNAALADDVAQQLRNADLAALLGRWLRIVLALARRGALERAFVEPGTLEFAAELEAVRQAALLNSGLNRAMQLQRLLLLWAALWPRLPVRAG